MSSHGYSKLEESSSNDDTKGGNSSPTGSKIWTPEGEDYTDQEVKKKEKENSLLIPDDAVYTTTGNEKKFNLTSRYPPSIRYIMGNELCERFSYYGFRAILALYLTKYLNFSEDNSTVIIHVFIFFSYFSALGGGYMSDSYLGKYRTIYYGSMLYAVGEIITSLTALPGVTGDPPTPWGAAIGLFMVSLGTGAIKACVSSFVGDQFRPGQEELLSGVFALFYFIINVGSLVSNFVVPLLREYFGYAAAFGVPAALMMIALLIYVIGKPAYRIIPPTVNVVTVMINVIKAAYRERLRAKIDPSKIKRSNFLDYAKGIFPSRTVEDVRSTLRVFTAFIPLPIFWALFDQQASRWIYQAESMNRNIFGWTITPDQVPTLNPLILLPMIWVFDKLIYPGLERVGLGLRMLSRMTIGMLLASLAFAASGTLELAIDLLPENSVFIAWQIPQYFLVCAGEVMVSITGLEFAYSQAPASMKSVVMAVWYLTIALGNALVALVAKLSFIFYYSWIEYYFYGVLMFVFMIIFVVINRNYTYNLPWVDYVDEPNEPGTLIDNQSQRD